MNEGLLREKQVLKLIPISKSWLWRCVKVGKFPKPVKLGPKITVWRKADIQAILDNPDRFFGC